MREYNKEKAEAAKVRRANKNKTNSKKSTKRYTNKTTAWDFLPDLARKWCEGRPKAAPKKTHKEGAYIQFIGEVLIFVLIHYKHNIIMCTLCRIIQNSSSAQCTTSGGPRLI